MGSRPISPGLCWLCLLILLFAPVETAFAQFIDRPADDRPELPSFEGAPGQEPILPPVAPPQEPGERLSAGPAVFVAGYRIVRLQRRDTA